jgi:hypothetical protein
MYVYIDRACFILWDKKKLRLIFCDGGRTERVYGDWKILVAR